MALEGSVASPSSGVTTTMKVKTKKKKKVNLPLRGNFVHSFDSDLSSDGTMRKEQSNTF